jgi:hypothetical protein
MERQRAAKFFPEGLSVLLLVAPLRGYCSAPDRLAPMRE